MERRNEVVVGVDGSPVSDAAVIWAAAEAHSRGAGLVIVYAIEEGTSLSWLPSSMIAAGLREFGRPTVKAARRTAQRAEPDVSVRTGVLIGSATRVLKEMSGHASMVVVGRTGRGSLLQFTLGSVPNRLAAAASCPVVTVPAPSDSTAPGPVNRVVIAVDEAYRREYQLGFALDEAVRRHADVVVLHAAEHADADPQWSGRLNRETARARQAHPWLRVSVEVTAGTLEEAVADLCKPHDLLVLGHRRPRLIPSALGANIKSALDAAPCPVAVVGEAALAHRLAFARVAPTIAIHAPAGAATAVACEAKPSSSG